MALISLIKRMDKNGRLRSCIRSNSILFWMYYGFFAKVIYYPQTRRKRVNIQKHGRELLQHVYILLTAEEVTFFVDFGTLLGIIREGRFLGHDLDIDIGVIIEDAHTREKVQRLLTNGGCELKKSFIYNGNVVEQSYTHSGIEFDICFYENEANHSVCYLFYIADDSCLMPGKLNVVKMRYTMIKHVEKHEFEGITINVPENPERLLEEKYGIDWRIPNKNWVYWKTPTAEYCDDLGTVITH